MGKFSTKKRFVEHFGKMIKIFFGQIQTKNVTLIKKIGSTILIDKIFKEQFDKYLLVKNIEI